MCRPFYGEWPDLSNDTFLNACRRTFCCQDWNTDYSTATSRLWWLTMVSIREYFPQDTVCLGNLFDVPCFRKKSIKIGVFSFIDIRSCTFQRRKCPQSIVCTNDTFYTNNSIPWNYRVTEKVMKNVALLVEVTIKFHHEPNWAFSNVYFSDNSCQASICIICKGCLVTVFVLLVLSSLLVPLTMNIRSHYNYDEHLSPETQDKMITRNVVI